MYQITISRVFSAAHAIKLYDGSNEPLHGHDWSVEVTVESEGLDRIEVVMDFHELQSSVDALLDKVHHRNLNEVEPFANDQTNPTAERVAWWIGTQLGKTLPDGVQLQSVRVGEAPGCVACFLP